MHKALSLVGIAKKAGRISVGESAVKDSIRFGKCGLVIIAGDASDNTKKSVINSCKYYGATYYEVGTKEEIGRAIGKGNTSSVSVNDEGLAKAIEEKLQCNFNGGDKL